MIGPMHVCRDMFNIFCAPIQRFKPVRFSAKSKSTCRAGKFTFVFKPALKSGAQ